MNYKYFDIHIPAPIGQFNDDFNSLDIYKQTEFDEIDDICKTNDTKEINAMYRKFNYHFLPFRNILNSLKLIKLKNFFIKFVFRFINELNTKFPKPDEIIKEKDKKEFSKLFGEYLRVENILQNYDEFTNLKALQSIAIDDEEALNAFKETHFVSDEDVAAMQKIELLKDRTIQDYRSTYNDIRDWLRREKSGKEKEESTIDWDDVVFEVDLLKSQEINLDYILELIFENNKKTKDKDTLITEIRRVIRASVGNRAKESLIVDFINETDLDTLQDKANVIDSFFKYAQRKQKEEASELITEESLNEEEAKRYITASLKREYASENGTELNALLPKMSPLNPQYLTKKQSVFQKLVSFVEKFKGVGGQL
jgi:type I restriction enzyme R subunit